MLVGDAVEHLSGKLQWNQLWITLIPQTWGACKRSMPVTVVHPRCGTPRRGEGVVVRGAPVSWRVLTTLEDLPNQSGGRCIFWKDGNPKGREDVKVQRWKWTLASYPLWIFMGGLEWFLNLTVYKGHIICGKFAIWNRTKNQVFKTMLEYVRNQESTGCPLELIPSQSSHMKTNVFCKWSSGLLGNVELCHVCFTYYMLLVRKLILRVIKTFGT